MDELDRAEKMDMLAEMYRHRDLWLQQATDQSPLTASEVDAVTRKAVVGMGGTPTCTLCGKQAWDSGHLKSKNHLAKLQEEVRLNRILGVAGSARRFQSSGGMRAPLTNPGCALGGAMLKPWCHQRTTSSGSSRSRG